MTGKGIEMGRGAQKGAHWTQIRDLYSSMPRVSSVSSAQALAMPSYSQAHLPAALAGKGRMMVACLPLLSTPPIAASGDRRQSRPSQEQSLESMPRASLALLPPFPTPLSLVFLCKGLVFTHGHRGL